MKPHSAGRGRAEGPLRSQNIHKERDKPMETKPTHEQAQLHLQIYEMRREARLRQARDWFFRNYFVNTLDDSMRIAAPGTEGGAFAMMVFGYWDQACALLNYGLLHEDLFFETSGEFFGVWERVKPTIEEGRKRFANRQFLAHLEKAANRYETWIEARSPGHIAAMREFSKQISAQLAKPAIA
jgi:hypothetical protein